MMDAYTMYEREWIHIYKIYSICFEEVVKGNKKFELCKDDVDVQIGDRIVLREYDPVTAAYTGRTVRKSVTYVLRNVPGLGLMDGYCIIGFR